MPETYEPDAGNGGGRLDRIERVLELLAKNQLAMQEEHREEFKKLMTWQVLTQDKIEKLATKIDKLGEKLNQQADMQAALDARVDKLVIAIGEFIRSSSSPK